MNIKLVITAALAVASLGAAAGAVDVSSVTAKATGNSTDYLGRPVTFEVQLTDGTRTCTSGTLEALVTNKGSPAIACWRIIGDNVYLTSMRRLDMSDALVPLSAFEGDGAAKLREMANGSNSQSTTQSASKTRASAMAAMQEAASGTYTGRVRAAIRPNVTYPDVDSVLGNPSAEFDVSLAPDGTIIGVKLRKSSGVSGWDDAAERALRKTDKLPRDTDGRTPSSLVIDLRPKD